MCNRGRLQRVCDWQTRCVIGRRSGEMTLHEEQQLRFLEAARVEHPDGTLDGFEVCTVTEERLGSIEGVLIEPAQRRVRYFVVGRRGWRRKRYLVPAECHARLDSDEARIYVEAGGREVRPYGSGDVPRFSDEDVLD